MNYYDKINWKNRSEGKTTKISAERLNHMDNQIFNNANAIGNVEKIADIGDGTLCGAAETLKETAEKLTQSLSKIVNPHINEAVDITNQTQTYYTLPSNGYVCVGGLKTGYRNVAIKAGIAKFNVLSCVFSDGIKINSMYMVKGTEILSEGNDGTIYFVSQS